MCITLRVSFVIYCFHRIGIKHFFTSFPQVRFHALTVLAIHPLCFRSSAGDAIIIHVGAAGT